MRMNGRVGKASAARRVAPVLGLLLGAGLASAQPMVREGEVPEVIQAAAAGALERVEELLEAGASLEATAMDQRVGQPWPVLLHAIAAQEPEVVRALLEAGATIASEPLDRVQWDAVVVAARWGDPDSLRALLDVGADLDARGLGGNTLLHEAAMWNDAAMVETLIVEGGLDVDAQNDRAETPLFMASGWFREMIEPDRADHFFRDPEALGRRLEAMVALLANSATVHAIDRNAQTPVGRAAAYGVKAQVETLLDWDARPFTDISSDMLDERERRILDAMGRDWRAIDPMILAAQGGDAGVIELLADAGGDLAVLDHRGRDLLTIAVESGNVLATRDLLKLGFDVEAPEFESGRTLLMRACLLPTDFSRTGDRFRGHTELARALIEGGADVEATDSAGRTPLHYAAASGLPPLVTLMLEAGADPEAQDANGHTPADYTTSTGPTINNARMRADGRVACREVLEGSVAVRGETSGDA